MEIVQERLEREYDLDLIVTAPSVVYKVHMNDGSVADVDSPAKLVDADQRQKVTEPYVAMEIFCPQEYTGALMELCQARVRPRPHPPRRALTAACACAEVAPRPVQGPEVPHRKPRRDQVRPGLPPPPHRLRWLRPAASDASTPDPNRVGLRYDLPLAEVITDFFDVMKSRSKGYACAPCRRASNPGPRVAHSRPSP